MAKLLESKWAATGLVAGIIVVVFALWWVFAGIGARNHEASLRAQYRRTQ